MDPSAPNAIPSGWLKNDKFEAPSNKPPTGNPCASFSTDAPANVVTLPSAILRINWLLESETIIEPSAATWIDCGERNREALASPFVVPASPVPATFKLLDNN